MSNEYVLIQAQGDGYGQIAVSNNVINHIVEITMDENEFIYFDESVKKSLNVTNKEGLFIDLKVRIQYGQNVDKICKKLQEDLQRSIELMVEYKNSVINLNVVGFRFK
ncbi:MAG TPA: Asp23/Gls24 family envelope stress response protein [Erysipelothrix sp.]|nr:Asp23/Gls24 family envelope stress response protein [Erysipelothrix sp.]